MRRLILMVVVVISIPAVARGQNIDVQRLVNNSLGPTSSYGFRNATSSIELPVGTFKLIAPLRINDAWGLTIHGAGPMTVIEADFDAPTGAAVELIGSNYCKLEDLCIRPAPKRSVGYGILAARKPASGVPPSAGNHFFSRVFMEGSYEVAAAGCIASECNLWQHCYFLQTGPGAALLVSNGGLPEIGVPHGASTMLEATWQDCLFSSSWNPGAAGDAARGSPLVRLVKDGRAIVGDLNFRGGGMLCQTALPAAVSFEAPGEAGQVQDIHFTEMRWETEPARHAFLATSKSLWKSAAASGDERKEEQGAGRSFVRISVRDCTITCAEEAIFAPGQQLVGWAASNVNLYVSTKSEFQKRSQRAAVVAGEFSEAEFRVPIGNAGHLFTHLKRPPLERN